MFIKVLGCDPSLSNFGFVQATIDVSTNTITPLTLDLVETAPGKNKKVRKNSDDIDRCRLLSQGLKRNTQGNMICFVEMPVGSQSARAMASYGACMGILSACDIPLVQLTPNEIKMSTVGSKTASKEDMITWAYNLYPHLNWIAGTKKSKNAGQLANKNEHLADAVATLHAGIKSEDFRSVVSILKMTDASL
jgi:Holliday junction resolvasome RuvABC endonuclease subunit